LEIAYLALWGNYIAVKDYRLELFNIPTRKRFAKDNPLPLKNRFKSARHLYCIVSFPFPYIGFHLFGFYRSFLKSYAKAINEKIILELPHKIIEIGVKEEEEKKEYRQNKVKISREKNPDVVVGDVAVNLNLAEKQQEKASKQRIAI